MSFSRRLALLLVLGTVVIGGGADIIDARYFPVPASWARTVRIVYPLVLLAVLGFFAIVMRALVAPIHAGLEAVRSGRGRSAPAAAVRAAVALPRRLAVLAFVLVLLISGTMVAWRVHMGVAADLCLARLVMGVGMAITVALQTSSSATLSLVEPLVELGGIAQFQQRSTMQRKLTVMSLALLGASVLLVCAVGYAGTRSDVEREYLVMARQTQSEIAGTVGLTRPAVAAQLVFRTVRAPTVLFDAKGQPIARSERSEDVALPGGAAGIRDGIEEIAGGWRLWTKYGDGSMTLVSDLPDAPLRARRGEFWAPTIVVAGLLLLLGAMLTVFGARALARPVGLLGEAARKMSSGDLTARPPSISADELGRLAVDFRHMAQGLSALVVDVQGASRGVAQGTQALSVIGTRVKQSAHQEHEGVVAVQGSVEAMQSSVSLVSHGIGTLADYVHSTSSAVSELAAALVEVRRQAGELEGRLAEANADVAKLGEAGKRAETELAALGAQTRDASLSLDGASQSLSGLESSAVAGQLAAAQAAESAERAGGVVEEAVAGIEKVRAAVDDAKRRVTVLGRRSDDIDHILDFVGEVAGRTNLLSLNASIIATQAGEHGKAFAVVADQIRELASQISSSTKSIAEIIRTVREDVTGTARLIERGDALAAQGVGAARRSLDALAELRLATVRGHESAAVILEAVQVHANSTRAVASLVESVTEGSHGLREAVQMIGKSVSGMGSVSRGLSEMVDQVSRALEEQSGVGQRQIESLSRIDDLLSEITRAVESHGAATRRVREAIAALKLTTAQHEAAVVELSSVGERLGGGSRALAERVGRFKLGA